MTRVIRVGIRVSPGKQVSGGSNGPDEVTLTGGKDQPIQEARVKTDLEGNDQRFDFWVIESSSQQKSPLAGVPNLES